MGEGERSLCLQAGGCRDSAGDSECRDAAEGSGGVTGRDSWIGGDDIMYEMM